MANNINRLYTFFLVLMLISLPFSTFGLSVAQFGLLGTWLLEGIFQGNFKKTLNQFLSNKPAIILVSFYLMHAFGMLYTSDWDYGLKDLRIKLPLLLLPVIFVTSQKLRNQNIDLLLRVFIIAVLAATFISFGILLSREISDFRELSPFISHIRLSLNVCLAIFFALHLAYKRRNTFGFYQITHAVTAVWLTGFLVMIESLTGLVILLIAGFILTIYGLFHFQKPILRFLSLAVLLIVPIGLTIYLSHTTRSFLTPRMNDLNNLDLITPDGGIYTHDTNLMLVENGSYIGVYICEEELRQEWEIRSGYPYDNLDDKNQKLKFTLIRYLNSKGLRKDAAGLNQLSSKDIRNIEMGIANVFYTRKFSLKSRLYKIFWEYQVIKKKINPGGHSLVQRIEYWKASVAIIKNHMLIGVGTGDIKNAYKDYYDETNSLLEPQFRHRAHNQYLAIAVAFGVIGLLWFLFSLIYPGLKQKKFFTYRYFVFWVTLSISMLVEDTLETQMGVTLFAFFNSLLLFGTVENEKNEN